MKIWWLSACILSAAVAAAATSQSTAPTATPRSVWDSVYTEAQATRGEKVSAEQCARCHGQTLTGAEAAPALVGDVFNANWESVPLGDLFERIRISMPQDTPGSLSRQQNADVIAYLLKAGRFPAGDKELATETTVLGQIRFISNRPLP
ncbi:MAG: cytochrome c [Acidobacteria bacterium]|nr:cytochrome c [Acidobacteriota bacterium]